MYFCFKLHVDVNITSEMCEDKLVIPDDKVAQ